MLESIIQILSAILNFTHKLTNNYGVDIVILTVIVRVCLYGLTKKSTKSMRAMTKIQPKMKEIQEKYKEDKKQLNEEVMALYKREGVNPMGGCLPLLLQMPIFISIFWMLRDPIHYHKLPGFGHAGFLGSRLTVKPFESLALPDIINMPGMLDLDKLLGGGWFLDKFLYLPSLWLVVLYIFTTIYQTKLMQKQNPSQGDQAKMQQYMFMPLFIMFGFIFPVGLLLYWGISNVLQMVQTKLIYAEMDREEALKDTIALKDDAGKTPRMEEPKSGKKKK